MSNTGFEEGPPKAEIITLTSVSLAFSLLPLAIREGRNSLEKPHASFHRHHFPWRHALDRQD